ncbi:MULTISPECIES: hypothetical protein [Thermodesulfobacterium]|jgi:hypothetical protein|uniref:Uncharacterized protein n=1 Tax=Thermodesulfobacterium commune DSM 2178 TaxID=289377 RepID=A0A075WUQ6_9BACT|nr:MULTISPECIES: hypothetical protein [Thermodesulfobacterium]AIH04606.1 hypothetical protein HL41_08000 [Thermodesulfobacterium commune DSM 2178]MDN5380246.1 hypothetical protein [Thermodesulfobacterium sp.]
MNQEFFISLIRSCIKDWGLKVFDKSPVLTEFFNYQKVANLKDFSYKGWYENDLLGLIMVITAEKKLVIQYAKKVYPHFMIDFNLLKNLDPFCLKSFQELIQELTQKVLDRLNQKNLKFCIKTQEFFRSSNLSQSFSGMLNLSFSYRIPPIGDLSFYLISGPKEYLAKRNLDSGYLNSFYNPQKAYLVA